MSLPSYYIIISDQLYFSSNLLLGCSAFCPTVNAAWVCSVEIWLQSLISMCLRVSMRMWDAARFFGTACRHQTFQGRCLYTYPVSDTADNWALLARRSSHYFHISAQIADQIASRMTISNCIASLITCWNFSDSWIIFSHVCDFPSRCNISIKEPTKLAQMEITCPFPLVNPLHPDRFGRSLDGLSDRGIDGSLCGKWPQISTLKLILLQQCHVRVHPRVRMRWFIQSFSCFPVWVFPRLSSSYDLSCHIVRLFQCWPMQVATLACFHSRRPQRIVLW